MVLAHAGVEVVQGGWVNATQSGYQLTVCLGTQGQKLGKEVCFFLNSSVPTVPSPAAAARSLTGVLFLSSFGVSRNNYFPGPPAQDSPVPPPLVWL